MERENFIGRMENILLDLMLMIKNKDMDNFIME